MDHIDLFSGIGGFALAAQANGLETAGFCEIDERCRDFLAHWWPGVSIHDDIRTFDGSRYAGATLLTAGVPCQPASRAGKQGGTADDRWLWGEVERVISEAKPDWVLCENPPGIFDVEIDRVPPVVESRSVARTADHDDYRGVSTRQGTLYLGSLCDALEGLGYDVAPPIEIPACAVNAPHGRARYWIVAHNTGGGRDSGKPDDDAREPDTPWGCEGRVADCDGDQSGPNGREPNARTDGRDDAQGGSEGRMADTEPTGRQRGAVQSGGQEGACSPDRGLCSPWSDYQWVECADGKFRRAPDDAFGVSHGLHRSVLGALGNSIVWPLAAEVIRAMMEATERGG